MNSDAKKVMLSAVERYLGDSLGKITVNDILTALAGANFVVEEGWRKVDARAKNGEPYMLFTPRDEPINCDEGVFWFSGGWGKGAIMPGFRGVSTYGQPTHYRPLPQPPEEG